MGTESLMFGFLPHIEAAENVSINLFDLFIE